jgi:hypothetical protein
MACKATIESAHGDTISARPSSKVMIPSMTNNARKIGFIALSL